jgi:hypothetical protein
MRALVLTHRSGPASSLKQSRRHGAARLPLDCAPALRYENGTRAPQAGGCYGALTGFGIAILSFSDPDGVHLELTAPL